MSAVEFNVSDLLRNLSGFERAADDMRTSAAVVAIELRNLVVQKFDEQGPGWDPLAASTVRQKGHARILEDSLQLKSGWEIDFGDDFAEAFTSVTYAGYHVTGTSRMPRRDPTDIDDESLQALADLVAVHVLSEAA